MRHQLRLSWLLLLPCIALLLGCDRSTDDQSANSEIKLHTNQQTAVLVLESVGAYYQIVDETGQALHMNDGLPIVLDEPTFVEQLLPRLGGGLADVLELEATFHLKKENVTTGVVESESGGADDVSKSCWVVKLDSIRSVKRRTD